MSIFGCIPHENLFAFSGLILWNYAEFQGFLGFTEPLPSVIIKVWKHSPHEYYV
jgi:hypothetical protein